MGRSFVVRYGVPAALFRRVALGGVLLAFSVQAALAATPPKFLPRGWRAELFEGRRDIMRFVSPDSRADLTMGDIPASGRDFQFFAARPGEHVTYRARKGSWMVVSGYRGGRIFYRRADLACSGKRWHVIEVTYPRADKRRLDAIVTHISHSLASYGEVCPD
jgi:hypothetical protein